MKDYLKRLAELAVAGFGVGATEYVVANGFHLTTASLHGLAVAGGLAAYGLIVKHLGDKNRPTVVK